MMDRRTAVRIIGTTSVSSLLALITACKRKRSPSGVINSSAADRPGQQGVAALMESVKLPGGRVVEVLLGGDPGGYPLVLHHGTPGDMTLYADWHALCRDRGLRLIGASRPGYAESSRMPHRSVADAAADIAAILDWLGHKSFVTMGWSGGGPHALACAALLPRRCVAAATLAGFGAYGEDLDVLAGMALENVAEFGAAIKGEETLRRWLNENATVYRSITGREIAEALGGLVPEVDKRALIGDFADHLAAVFRRSLVHGFDGWIDDDLALVRPWGFKLGEIGVPVAVWQGELDLMVPLAHGRWLLEKIPGATRHIVPGQGHISLAVNFRPEILDDLRSRTQNR